MQRSSCLSAVVMLAFAACSDSSTDDAGSGAELGCRDPMDESFCTQFIASP